MVISFSLLPECLYRIISRIDLKYQIDRGRYMGNNINLEIRELFGENSKFIPHNLVEWKFFSLFTS